MMGCIQYDLVKQCLCMQTHIGNVNKLWEILYDPLHTIYILCHGELIASAYLTQTMQQWHWMDHETRVLYF